MCIRDRRYTRAGNFALNAAGEIVTKDGMRVMSTSDGPITVGEGKVEIRDGGVVSVDGNEVATMKVVTLGDTNKIEKEGFSRFIWKGEPNGVQAVTDAPVKS